MSAAGSSPRPIPAAKRAPDGGGAGERRRQSQAWRSHPGAGRLLVALACLAAALAFSLARADDALDARLKSLETELRCLVCQNQTLAESNAPLAEDLRREVRELAQGGRSNDEIKQYLVARYGDFVLYKPPVKPTTYLLWFGPFLLLAGGAVTWLVVLRRRARMPADDAAPGDTAAAHADTVLRARALLDE